MHGMCGVPPVKRPGRCERPGRDALLTNHAGLRRCVRVGACYDDQSRSDSETAMKPDESVFDPYIAWRFTAPPAKCSYIADETASLDYRISRGMPPDVLGELLRRDWRRHGAYVFRPACPVCRKCRSVRVDVNAFEASKSQRRCRQRNTGINVVMQRPTVTPAHIALYNKWHDDRTEQRQRTGRPHGGNLAGWE